MKYVKSKDGTNYHVITDEDNKTYYMNPSSIFFQSNDFDKIWGSIRVGKFYDITGYGVYLPLLNIYPYITHIE